MDTQQPSLMCLIKHSAVGGVVWDTPPPLKPSQDGTHVVIHHGDGDTHGHGGAPYMFGGSMDGMVVGTVAGPLKYRVGVTGHHHDQRVVLHEGFAGKPSLMGPLDR